LARREKVSAQWRGGLIPNKGIRNTFFYFAKERAMVLFDEFVAHTSVVSIMLLVGTTSVVFLYLLLQITSLVERILTGQGKQMVADMKARFMPMSQGVNKPLRKDHKAFWIAVGIGYGLGGLFLFLPVIFVLFIVYLVFRYIIFRLV
jgi:Fe2+ transport system protein B